MCIIIVLYVRYFILLINDKLFNVLCFHICDLIINCKLFMLLENSSNTRHSILNSPNGKIVEGDNDQNFCYSHSKSLSNNKNSNTPMFSSAKTKNLANNTADKLMPNCGILIFNLFIYNCCFIIIIFLDFQTFVIF